MRVARVVPDVAGLDAEFDYSIPDKFDHLVHVGTIVRVTLHNRRVRGWVIDADATPPTGVRLLPIQLVSGFGPDQELIDLAGWASWRYAGKRSFFLQTASPPKAVRSLKRPALVSQSQPAPNDLLVIPPARSPLPEVLEAGNAGPTLLITPTQRSASGWVRSLRAEGKRVAFFPDDWAMAAEGRVDFVVGTRAAVWSPMPTMAAVVIVDAHDQGLQSEASPTWDAVVIASERARRRNASCRLISSVPRIEQERGRVLVRPDRSIERAGWAALNVVDQRGSDPRTGLYSAPVVSLLRSDKRVVCVLNRKGRAQLLVCSNCDETARCGACNGAQHQNEEQLVCSRCGTAQPVICRHCSRTKFKHLRVGVQRVREELESLALKPVIEITGDTKADDSPTPDAAHVTVGTEAVLYRIRSADAVVFLDFDQDLMSPRYRANEDALLLLARASRLVGGRSRAGTVTVQTRQPDHEVIDAALHGDPFRFTQIEHERRRLMNWPPNSALARIAGTAAPGYVERLKAVDAMAVEGGAWLIQAPDHQLLCDALAEVKRPTGGTLRVEIDPPRV